MLFYPSLATRAQALGDRTLSGMRQFLPFLASSVLLTATATASGQIAVLDSFDYADAAALTAAGYQPALSTSPAISTTFALNPVAGSFLSPSKLPAPVEGQSLLTLTDATVQLPIGGTTSGDFTLSASLLLNGYNATGRLGLLNPAGQGYLLDWSAGAPTANSGNGVISLRRTSSFTSLTPSGVSLASATSLTTPTGYPLPLAVTNPLVYAPDDFFIGFSTITLTFTAATSTLEVTQDGSPLLTATDTTLSNFSHLTLSGTGAGASFDNVIVLAEVTVPEPSAAIVFAPLSALLWRRRP